MRTMRSFRTATAAAALATALPAFAQVERANLLADDGAADDRLGVAVAVDGPVAILGATGDDDGAADAGAVYVFRDLAGTWTPIDELLAPDADPDDRFGTAVALDGGLALIGAPGDDEAGEDAGAAYLFRDDGGTWSFVTKLTADGPSPGDEFGFSVSIDGDRAVVGAFRDDDAGDDAGAVHVYRNVDGTWTWITRLTADDAAANDELGWSVAIDGTRVVAGAFRDDDAGSASGAAYVFEDDGDAWTQVAKLTADDAGAGDQLGFAVAISGARVLAGAHRNDEADTNAGAAYVFEGTGGPWEQTAKLTAADADGFDWFGFSVALDGGLAVIGARLDDDAGTSSGSAYAFGFSDGGWVERTKLFDAGGAAFDEYGYAVAVRNGTALVGSYLDDPDAARENAGSAFVYDVTRLECADQDGDGNVGFQDLLALLVAWGTCPPPCPEDLDDDGAVGFTDLLTILAAWGPCVPTPAP